MAGELGTEGMQNPAPYSAPSKYNDYYTYDYHIPEGLPVDLEVEGTHWEKNLRRTGKGLTFETKEGVKIAPLYDVHRQRYVVYWNLKKKK